MNAAQRRVLTAHLQIAADALAAIQALNLDLSSLAGDLESMQEEEQGKFDNLSEGLQQGEKGQAIEQAASDLGDMHGLAQEAAEAFDTLLEKLEELAGHDIP